MAKILLVCADDWAGWLISQLQGEGHSCQHVSSEFRALDLCKSEKYEILLLGWQGADLAGRCILSRYRTIGGTMPVMVLTASDCLQLKISAFDAGADDVLSFPPHPLELQARLRAFTRRFCGSNSRMLEAGNLTLDSASRKVFKNEQEIPLLSKEYKLLEFLMRNPNQSFTAEAIMERLWKSDAAQSTDTVRTHIKTLRQKLGVTTGGTIVTRRGLGYAFESGERQRQLA